MNIQQICASKMSLEQLEAEKAQRDDAIAKLRAEKMQIRKLLEPLYVARNGQGLSPNNTVLKVGK